MPDGYLTADGIDGVVVHLAATYSALTELLTLPETSVEQRTIHGLRIAAGSSTGRRAVLLLGGVHARELVNPDLLVTFATKLLQAYTSRTALQFGSVSHPRAVVNLIVENLDLIIVPLVNPDGRAFVQHPAGDPMWRKNRNPNPGQPCKGVDLNRNYDFLWSSGIGTSALPCSEIFRGESAFSEPETRNIRHLLDTFPNIVCLADVHSFSELVLYPWGDDDNQSTDPSMNFTNPAFDGQRGVSNTGYREYIPSSDATWHKSTAVAVADAIAALRGRTYTPQQGISLYPTSATVHDYAYSRHFVQASDRKVLSFTIETAQEFQPPWTEAAQVIDEVCTGLMTLLQRAICAAERLLSGSAAAAQVDQFRVLRDEVLLPSPFGRQIASFVEVYGGELAQAVADKRVKKGDVVKLASAWAKAAKPDGGISKAPVPATVVDRADALLDIVTAGASPGLRRAATKLQRDAKEFRDRSPAEALRIITKKRRLK